MGTRSTAADLSEEFSGSACRRMAGLAAKLAERDQDEADFLRAFGLRAAGIRPPPARYGDLARGGRNLIAGRGFLARFDDGSAGQVRHFAGIAVASTFGGGGATRFLSIFVRDDPLRLARRAADRGGNRVRDRRPGRRPRPGGDAGLAARAPLSAQIGLAAE